MRQTCEIRTVKIVEVEWTDTWFGVTHGFLEDNLKDDWVTVTARGAGATLVVYPCREKTADGSMRRFPATSVHDSVEDAMEAGGMWLGERA
jgi:hypothetical protein